MTSKEAKGNLMHALKWNDMPEKEALKIAIKALDNEDVLDKIISEIEQTVDHEMKEDKKWVLGLRYTLQIIDKYGGDRE